MGKKFGRYELVERISFGGMAEVYIGRSSGVEGFEKVLAIKRMLPSLTDDEDFVTMFIDEAKISAQLTHFNIGQVYEFGQCDDQYYIAMEYIQGMNMRSVHEHFYSRNLPMPVDVVLRLARDICNGLDYAHCKQDATGKSMDIVHRDISPQNILISFDGSVKIIDFGIAKALDRATKTQGGQIKGKYGYMSPEQANGSAMDGRSDLFSVGILMFEMLTGRPLFQGNTAIHTLQKVINAEVPTIPDLNPLVDAELEALIHKVLAKQPDDRFASGDEMHDGIEEYVVRAGHTLSSKQLSIWMKETFPEKLKEAGERLSRATSVKPAPEPAPPAPSLGAAPEPAADLDAAALVAGMMDAVPDDDEATIVDTETNAAVLAELMAKGQGVEATSRPQAAPAEQPERMQTPAPAAEEPATAPHLAEEATAVLAPVEEKLAPEEATAVVAPAEEKLATAAAPPKPASTEGGAGRAGKPIGLIIGLILLLGAGGGAAYWFLMGQGGQAVDSRPASAPPPTAKKPAPPPEPKKAAAPAEEKEAAAPTEQKEAAAPTEKKEAATPTEKKVAAAPTKEKEAAAPAPSVEKARPTKKRPAAAARPRRPRKPGYLIVVAPRPSKIFVDGKDTGRKTPIAPSNPLSLTPGRHRVKLEEGGKSSEHRVTIKSGQTAKLIHR